MTPPEDSVLAENIAGDVGQANLPLDAPPLPADIPLLPARMLNEYSYCPRLAYLEWVQGEWADSADTVDGRLTHRRVDRPSGKPPLASKVKAGNPDPPGDDATEPDSRIHVRSLELSSQALGITAKLDLAEFDGVRAVPVDYKRGKRPHLPRGAYEPERIQLCAQGLLLEAEGFVAPEGVLYFAASKERVPVVFDDELKAATRAAAAGLRLIATGGQIPPPLENSPKCPRCSLAPICLPDEVHYLRHGRTPPRAMAVSGTPALPMYVQARGAKVSKEGDVLQVSVDDNPAATARLMDVSQMVLQGGVYLTTPALHELMARQIPVTWLSYGGWFLGHTGGLGHKNVELRTAQYRASFDARQCLQIARDLVASKIRNQRTLLRRNWKAGAGELETIPESVLLGFRQDIDAAERARSIEVLLGIEGNAAARYFQHFRQMISPELRPLREPGSLAGGGAELWSFDFTRRTRRPPTDPINALLSYGYAMLTRALAVTLTGVGFDALRGYYHQPRYGRPALALDMMEPFRPLLADSTVLTVINNREIGAGDFLRVAGAVGLNDSGRRAFIAAFERRLSQEVTHPVFGYSAQYRQVIEIQCRLLGRHLLGEIDRVPAIVTR